MSDSIKKEQIHKKGFDMYSFSSPSDFREESVGDYKKINVNGVRNLEDATLNLGLLRKSLPQHEYVKKPVVMRAIALNNLKEQRNISDFYYNINGIYQRACNYFAFLYRYDWYIAPEISDKYQIKEEAVLKDFTKLLNFFDESDIKKLCGEIALQTIVNGAYYGYIVPDDSALILQNLPADYCRSRYTVRGMPAVEFNMKFFDTFADTQYRAKILNLFPDEFKKGYMAYKQNKIKPDLDTNNSEGWYPLDPENCIKFNFYNGDMPLFINAIPALLDLDAAQDLDRRKQMQKLLKIIIQKLPRDKNGDLLFDIEEARDIHNTTVNMLKRAIGVDVITTFADIESVDMSDKNTATTKDDLEKVERTVFNSFGISQNLFNTDGNLSLKMSILNDEASVRSLLFQFNTFFNRIIKRILGTNKKYRFKFYMLETTQYNYQELSKLYKEQAQMGESRMLPQIALGYSQSFILNSINFENNILHLPELMVPPLTSATMSSNTVLGKKDQDDNSKNQNNVKTTRQASEDKQTGRPETPDEDKSEKTIQNREAMS